MSVFQAFPQDCSLAVQQALSNIQVPDVNGVLQTVPVMYFSPESELVVEQHPSIYFSHLQTDPDPTRVSNNLIKDNWVLDANGNPTAVNIRQDADPYILRYDIRIYTLFERDSNTIEKNIMTIFPMRGILNVNGNKLAMSLEKRLDLAKAAGALSISNMKVLEREPQREQVISLRYKVLTAFDIYAATTYKTASTITPNTTSK